MPIVLSTVGVKLGFNGPALPSVLAEPDGIELYAVSGRSQVAHRTAIERLAHAGAVPTTALAVVTELFRDWAGPLGGPAGDVIYCYSRQVPKLTGAVGVTEAEKRAASAHGGN